MCEPQQRPTKYVIIDWFKDRFYRNYNSQSEQYWKYFVLGQNGRMEEAEMNVPDSVIRFREQQRIHPDNDCKYCGIYHTSYTLQKQQLTNSTESKT